MIFDLSTEEKERLRKFGGDRNTIFALKKLFMNVCFGKPASLEVRELAAERLAQTYIEKAFHELSVINPGNQAGKDEENLV